MGGLSRAVCVRVRERGWVGFPPNHVTGAGLHWAGTGWPGGG